MKNKTNQPANRTSRKPYAPPKVTRYGSLTELTQTGPVPTAVDDNGTGAVKTGN